MEKKYEQALNNLDAEASLLLGTFDENKNYSIDDKTLLSLLNCRKLIKSYKEEVISAEASIGGFKFEFVIYIQLGEDNKKRAGMFVKEKAKLGFAEKELQTYVGSIVLENNGNFFSEVKKFFHLFTQDESTGIDMDNLELLDLINKLKAMKGNYKVMLELLMDYDREYVLKMLSILRGTGYYGNKLLEEFGAQIKKMHLNKLDPNYWRNLKVTLDTLLLNNKGMFDAKTQSMMDQLQREYLQKTKNIKPLQKDAKKKGSKKPAPKKAGGGGKKKSKKKPDGQNSTSTTSASKPSRNASNSHNFKYEFKRESTPSARGIDEDFGSANNPDNSNARTFNEYTGVLNDMKDPSSSTNRTTNNSKRTHRSKSQDSGRGL